MQKIKDRSVSPYLVLVVVLALAVVTGPVYAQKADRPEVKVGDRWQFVIYTGPATSTTRVKSDRLWVVTSVNLAGIEGTENGKPLALTRDLNTIESPRGTDTGRRVLSFPLEVGQKWEYIDDYVIYDPHFGTLNGRFNGSVEVVGYEKVRVPAGEFDAFKLELKGKWLSPQAPGPGETSFTYWYAPAARAVVKSEEKSSYMPPVAVELTEFHLQP